MGTIYYAATGGGKGGKKKEPDAPPSRSMLTEGRSTLNALQELLPQQFDISGQAAGATTDLLAKYGPGYASALRASAPSPLQDELERQAAEELAAGSGLTPSMRRETEQYVRAGQAARGFGYGPSDLTEEVLTLGSAGEQLKANRRAFAQSVQQAEAPERMLTLQSLLGFAPQPSQFNAFSPYAEDLYNTDYNAAWTDKISTRNYNAAIRAALIGAVGELDASIVGGASKAAAGCWVARVVFGEQSALWRLFERWLFEQAPGWFRWCYLRYGERVAAWLRDKPLAKALVRRWMIGKIWRRIETFHQHFVKV